MQSPTILVAEDDPKTAGLLATYLRNEGYRPVVADNGRRAVELFAQHEPQLVILDVMMPGADGFEVCAELRRASNVPILFLSARDHEVDKVLGLGLGGDDFVSKPFSPRELVARVKALLRRAGALSSTSEPRSSSIHGLSHSPEKRRFSLEGEWLELTVIEYTLLLSLYSSPGRVFLRGELLDRLYPGGESVVDRVVDVHIGKLRQKLGDDPNCPTFIHTVRGSGYRFADSI